MNWMKKISALLLIACLPFIFIGCGQKKSTGTDTYSLTFDGTLLGSNYQVSRNLATVKLPMFPTTVDDVSYEILNNTGGAGTVIIADVPLNTPCPATPPATPLATLDVPAGINSSTYATFGPGTAAGFTGLVTNDYTMCGYVTQGSPAMVFTLQLAVTTTQTFGL